MYVGEHHMDERTGYGKMVWPDGAEYGGLWNNGALVEVAENLDFTQVRQILLGFVCHRQLVYS